MNSEDVKYSKISERLDLPSPLRKYQWEGVSFFIRSESALLADEMGLGKTVQSAVALSLMLKEPQINRVLIIVPASLRLNWKRELSKWVPDVHCMTVTGNQENRLAYYCLPIPILIASYEQIQADVGSLHPCVRFDLVVLDEAQKIKNASSSISLACKLLPRDRSWALTGTPVENKPEDLISIFSFVKQGLLCKGLPLYEIHDRMQPYFLRRDKSSHLKEMPPIIIQDLPVEMKGNQREAYDDIWENRKNLLKITNSNKEIHLLSIITKLKKMCNYDPCSDQSAKFDFLWQILDSLKETKEKILVFSQYVKTIKWLANKIDGVSCDIYHGGMNEKNRDTAIQAFEGKDGPRVLLISLRAGGVGLNLQSASIVILFDRWWNPAVENQAIQRAHRFGRQLPLHVIRFYTEHSIEEKISLILGSVGKPYIDESLR